MTSRFLTVPQVAEYCLFTETAPKCPLEATRQWLRREAIPVLRRGRTGRVLMVERAAVEAALVRG